LRKSLDPRAGLTTPGTVTITGALVVCLLLGVVLGPAARVAAQSMTGAIWGQRQAGQVPGEVGSYHGASAYIRYYPSSSAVTATGAFVAVSDLTRLFMESGAQKNCSVSDCQLHPYTSWQDVNGVGDQFIDQSVFLGIDQWYQYAVYNININTYRGQWCSGVGCFVLMERNLGINVGMTHVVSGGETAFAGHRIGSLVTSDNHFLLYGSTTWQPWCWTHVTNNLAAFGGSISGCNPAAYEWSVSY
jgi:hypothetical protein